MNQFPMTSMQRVLTTLEHREPDRVPLFLMLTLHGAKELGLSIKTYFSTPENVVEGQMRLLRKYRHDCIYSFFTHLWKLRHSAEKWFFLMTALPTPANR